jgi:hypothetical protein
VTKEAGGWFQVVAASLFGGRIGFGAGDILLNVHLERCLRLRTLHSNASNINVWSRACVDRERWQIVGIDTFGRTVISKSFGNQIARSWRTKWSKLEENYPSISQMSHCTKMPLTKCMSPMKV